MPRTRKALIRLAVHVPLGILIVLASSLHWTLPLSLAALFVYYEHNEDHWLRDQAWYDVVGALWGMALATLAWIILSSW